MSAPKIAKLENIAVLLSRNPPHFLDFLPDRFWIIAPAALETVKWCALITAIFAVPAAIFAVWRVIVS